MELALFGTFSLKAHTSALSPSTANERAMRPKRSAWPFSMIFIYIPLNSLSEATLCFLAVPHLDLYIDSRVKSC